jgi:hypothetical protein
MRRDPPGTDGPYGPVDGPPIRVFVDEGAKPPPPEGLLLGSIDEASR